MKNCSMSLLIFLIVIFHFGFAYSEERSTDIYSQLFIDLPGDIFADMEVVNNFFDPLIEKYIEAGRTEFGIDALNFLPGIAVVNGSLILGYAEGKGRTRNVYVDDVKAIKNYFDSLFLPLYAFALPQFMLPKRKQFVFKSSILPTFNEIINFENVENDIFKIAVLSKRPTNGQLLMLKAITGYAIGIALAENRKLLKASDLKSARVKTCQYWPECRDMLSQKLSEFDKNYKEYLKTFYFTN